MYSLVATYTYAIPFANLGDESFTLSAGDWNDSLGINLAGLEGTYNSTDSTTINFGPFLAGTAPFLLGSNVGTADVTIHGNTVNFPSSKTLSTNETITATVSNMPPGSANKPLYLYNNLDL